MSSDIDLIRKSEIAHAHDARSDISPRLIQLLKRYDLRENEFEDALGGVRKGSYGEKI